MYTYTSDTHVTPLLQILATGLPGISVVPVYAEVWVYVPQPGANNFRDYRARDYTATCTKRVRKTVRSR